MNPEETIRPWLLACLSQYGVKEVHMYRWPDAGTRQQEPYVTITPLLCIPTQDGTQRITTAPASGNNANEKLTQQHESRYQIDYYESQDGLEELARCVMLGNVQKVKNILFTTCSLKRVEANDDITDFDADVINYHQRMVVVFGHHVQSSITDLDAVVDLISFNLNSDHPTYEISRSGYSPT